jgi:long-chain acyl-CoA synthetase
VVQKKGKLVALVHLNMDELEKKYHALKEDVSRHIETITEEMLRELHVYVNTNVNKFSQIHKVELQQFPFQKTATLKIKRFLYT